VSRKRPFLTAFEGKIGAFAVFLPHSNERRWKKSMKLDPTFSLEKGICLYYKK
jgi:hypothetical protein